MGQNFTRKKLEKCYKIYEQICEDPFISCYKIAQNSKMTLQTVTKYLQD